MLVVGKGKVMRTCRILEFGTDTHIWVFPKIMVPQNGWFIMENPIKMDDLGASFFLETPIYVYILYQVLQVVTSFGPIFVTFSGLK